MKEKTLEPKDLTPFELQVWSAVFASFLFDVEDGDLLHGIAHAFEHATDTAIALRAISMSGNPGGLSPLQRRVQEQIFALVRGDEAKR